MKLRLTGLTAAAVCLFSVGSVQAYPIYYKCDAKKEMTEVLTGQELTEKLRPLLALPQAQQRAALTGLCAGQVECENQLSQIMEATKIDRQVAEALYEQELKRIEGPSNSAPVHKLDEQAFTVQKKILNSGFGGSACRNTIEKLTPENFTGTQNNLFIYYPHHSEYTYATGCRPLEGDDWACQSNSSGDLRNAIRKAVIGGVDPYFVIAIGLMEGGANGVQSLYLDPIGEETALGCTAHSATKDTPGVLSSYGTFYKIDSGIVHNKGLAERLSETTKKSGATATPGESSYYCQSTNSADGSIVSSATPNQCCIQLSVSAASANSNGGTGAIRGQLLMEFLRSTQNSQLPGKSDPAFRIQHFNGFSKLMGGSEGVSTFRSGVNYYETPAYGYQGMDFVLNSLVSNPAIRAMVDQITKETDGHYPSILCNDVAVPGTYQVDSDSYFKKHRDSPRLQALFGKSFESMTQREKNVLIGELNYPKVRAQLLAKFPTLPKELNGIGTGYYANWGLKIEFPNHAIYEVQNGVPSKPQGTLPETSDELLKDVQSGVIPIDSEKAKSGLTVSYAGVSNKITFQGNFSPSKWNPLDPTASAAAVANDFIVSFGDGVLVYTEHVVKVENQVTGVSMKVLEGPTDWAAQSKIVQTSDEKVELPDHSGFTVHHLPQSQNGAQTGGFGMGGMYGSGWDYKISYSDGQSISYQEGDLNKLDKQVPANPVPSNMDPLIAYYFKTIYPSRNTVGKASPLAPWSDLTEDQLKVVANYFQTGSQPGGNGSTGYMPGVKATSAPDAKYVGPMAGSQKNEDNLDQLKKLTKTIIDKIQADDHTGNGKL